MRFFEVLTIVFVALKLMDIITWSWWLVLLPEIIAVILYIVVFILAYIDGKRKLDEIKAWNRRK